MQFRVYTGMHSDCRSLKFANARVRAGKGGRGMLGSWYDPKQRKTAKYWGGHISVRCTDLDPELVQQGAADKLACRSYNECREYW